MARKEILRAIWGFVVLGANQYDDRMRRFMLFALAVLAAVFTQAFAQPRGRGAGEVRVEWLGGDACWFREQNQGQVRFTRVDLATGERSPLFDAQRLAAALAGRVGGEIDPANLPIESLTFDGSRLAMLLRDRAEIVSVDLATYEVSPASPKDMGELALRPVQRVQRSRDGGPSSAILVVNSTGGPVSMFWIDSSGQKHPYSKVEAGASHRQHTYAGHAWTFEGPDGAMLGSVRAQREARIVVLGDLAGSPSGVGGDERDGEPETPPGPERPRDPAVSPDGTLVVFFKDHNVGIREVEGGAEHMITTDGNAEVSYGPPVDWSPDGSRVVVPRITRGDDRKVHYIQSSPRDQLQPRLRSYDYPKPGDRIDQYKPQLLDAKAFRQVPVSDELFANPWSISDIRWAADSSRFTFVFNQRGHQALRVIAVDAATGRASAIIDETSPTFIDYSQKFFRHDVGGTGETVWASERDGWNHLYLYDGATGAVKNRITGGEWNVRSVEHVDEERRQVWFQAVGIVPGQDPYHVHHARVNFDGSGLTVLTAGDGTHRVTFSPDRRYIVDTYSRVDLPPVTEIRRTADGSLVTELDRGDSLGNAESNARTPMRFVAKGRDGVTDIYGVILWPADFDPAKKYPVIESIYAGPHGAHVPKAYNPGLGQNDLTGRGFFVVMIDGMGTNWRGKAFHDVCWKNIGDAGFPDRILWIKAAAEQVPQMDLENGGRGVGIYGGSAGGQNAMRALIDHHDFYKVAVADCGCHDNRMDKIWWNEAWMGWPVGPEYEASSNVAQAHKLEGRLLLIVGEMDENVDPASTMQVVDALIQADKDFDMLVLPNTGHGAAETPYGRKRRVQHFMKYLAPPPG
ncbi:MAG: hypothetical protein AMXMBFR58_20910 [Phycisphaerae bacterium]